MNLRQFFIGRAIGFCILILVGGVVGGGYLIWRDGFSVPMFLMSLASLAVLIGVIWKIVNSHKV